MNHELYYAIESEISNIASDLSKFKVQLAELTEKVEKDKELLEEIKIIESSVVKTLAVKMKFKHVLIPEEYENREAFEKSIEFNEQQITEIESKITQCKLKMGTIPSVGREYEDMNDSVKADLFGLFNSNHFRIESKNNEWGLLDHFLIPTTIEGRLITNYNEVSTENRFKMGRGRNLFIEGPDMDVPSEIAKAIERTKEDGDSDEHFEIQSRLDLLMADQVTYEGLVEALIEFSLATPIYPADLRNIITKEYGEFSMDNYRDFTKEINTRMTQKGVEMFYTSGKKLFSL